MWTSLASIILRNRLPILIAMAVITLFMGYQATNVRMSYKMSGMLPHDDTTYISYQNFIENFSEDGNVIVLGVDSEALFEFENFKKWYDLANEIKGIKVPVSRFIDDEWKTIPMNAVDSVFSIGHCYTILKNEEERKFIFKPVFDQDPYNQNQVDSVLASVRNLPFYDGILYQDSSNATIMTAFVNAALFNSEERGPSMEEIYALVTGFEEQTGIDIKISGLPYIRTEMTTKVKSELRLFVLLAALVTAILLLLFFRSFRVMFVCLGVVGIGVVWSIGAIALFDFPITMLMGIIPPLIIVIGVPNCVYLLNKYHSEFKKHGNKAKALTRTIQKIGNATFLTNATTAMGFATFIFTHSDVLKNFGVIASLNILAVFVISIVIIPTIFSYLPPPESKHTKHLDRKWVFGFVNSLVTIVTGHRKMVYLVALLVVGFGLYGISKMETTGNLVDDLPEHDKVITDLKWFESKLNGIMPFEIIIDARRGGQITKRKNLKKIEKLQRLLAEYPEFSKSLSIVDATKFAKQAFYGGKQSKYSLMTSQEEQFIGPYFQSDYETGGVENTFLDSTKKMTRVTAQVADIGTREMDVLMKDLRPRIDSIFSSDKFDVTVTGTSVVFLKGTNYMVNNLLISLLLAIVVIATVMALLFKSMRMVLISLVPNILPLVFTAAIMGYFGIPIKPSTILVFSIAFGISVDDTIHFLAKYRQELKFKEWNIRESIILAVQETGVSMMYTSIVLFFGFGMFALSEFDGTRALGILVSVTLLFAMFTNLVLLPSLLLSFERYLTTKAFSEPFLVIIDEEEDIELEELQIKKESS